MSPVFDAVSGIDGASSWTHTCSGTNRFLYVVTDTTCTTVTYSGVPMTVVHSLAMTTGAAAIGVSPMQVWGLVAPATGANTVARSPNSSGSSISYTDHLQSLTPDAVTTNKSSTSATSLTTTIATVTDNCWLLFASFGYFFGVAQGVGAGLTFRRCKSGLGGPMISDSNGPKTPAGSHSGTTTMVGSAGEPIYHIVIAMAPAAPAPSGGGEKTSVSSFF